MVSHCLCGNESSVRNSKFELLRIISMLMIVFHHFAIHTDFAFDPGVISPSGFWYNFIIMGGKIAVNIFVLISGYFLITDEKSTPDFKRLLKLWGQIAFYSVLIFLIFTLSGLEEFSVKSMVKALFPITFNKWWFASTYFVMYLLHPFINRFLRSLEKRQYQKFLILIVICFSVIPTFTLSDFQGNKLIWFICLYSIAGYIRIYGLNEKISRKNYFALWVVFSALTYLTSFVISVLGTRYEALTQYVTYFYGLEKVTSLLVSLCLFMAFQKMKNFYSKPVNVVASTAFGIYLIHDNETLREYLWSGIFKEVSLLGSLKLPVCSVAVVLIVFAVCSIADLLRQYTAEKIFIKAVNKYADKLLKIVFAIVNYAGKIVFGK